MSAEVTFIVSVCTTLNLFLCIVGINFENTVTRVMSLLSVEVGDGTCAPAESVNEIDVGRLYRRPCEM